MASAEIPILLVEPEPLVREMLQAALRLHRGHLAPVAAAGPQEALRLAAQAEFKLVVSEMEIPTPAEGHRLLRRLAEMLPGTPILALTEGSRAALSALIDLDVAVVTKPTDMDHLLRRVDELLDRQTGSFVRGISLEGLLQVLKAERKTCRVVVQGRDAGGLLVDARLGFIAGRLVHAETTVARGPAALFEALGWREPVLRIGAGDTEERTIEADLDSLLLRFCVEIDHRRHEAEGGWD
jgi:DNA-binding response OmpR family regulator